MKTLLFFSLLLLLTGCDYRSQFEKLVPQAELHFAETFLKRLQAKDLDFIRQHLDSALSASITDEKLLEIALHFPEGELLSTQFIGANLHHFGNQWQGNFTYEYQFSSGWAVANAVVEKVDGELFIVGVNVHRTEFSLAEASRFSLLNKSLLQYVFLFAFVMAPIFSLLMLYICFRTPRLKFKWLWAIFILIGFGAMRMNWATGDVVFHPLFVQVLSASMVTTGPVAPWILSVSLPIGAIIFGLMRHRLQSPFVPQG